MCFLVDTFIIGDLYGCTDPTAYNYDPLANIDDGSCIPVVYGCTDSTMFNYNSSANTDDGSCIPFIYGCMDSIAYYYDSQANTDDGSCCYVAGCTDPAMFNYNAAACYEDGSCVPFIYGCTDSLAFNYDSSANTDDGSCQYCDLSISLMVMQESSPSACDGWAFVNASSSNTPITYYWSTGSTQNNIVSLCTGIYTLTVTDAVGCSDDGIVTIGQVSISGCTDPTADNYDATATLDDGSCTYTISGCTDPTATNYNAAATTDDGSCTYATSCTGTAPITGVFVDGIIDTRATFNWDNMNTAVCDVDQLLFRYREVGTSAWLSKTFGQPLGTTTTYATSKTVLGLLPATTYEYQFKIWYAGVSTPVNFPANPSGTFTTLGVCPNVANLAVTTPTTTKATFTWDASNGAYSFVRLKARLDTISNPQASDWFAIGGTGVAYGTYTKDKNGLVPGETYRGQARTFCDPNGGAYFSPAWTALVTWTQPTSIRLEGGESIANLDVYPNPSRDVFNITFTSETVQNLKVRVINLVGEEIILEDLQQFVGEYTKSIDLVTYTKGVYFLEITTNNGIVNKKLILQ
jgi:hypothetical protein